MRLKAQPNEMRCGETVISHRVDLPQCCPISGNPQPNSWIEIEYVPEDSMLEVASLSEYIDSYVGGRSGVRSMEGMIQSICRDCADCIGTSVCVKATLGLEPVQFMTVRCRAIPVAAPPVAKRTAEARIRELEQENMRLRAQRDKAIANTEEALKLLRRIHRLWGGEKA